MALPFDYELKVMNNNRAYWDVADDGNLTILVNGGDAVIRARLAFPNLVGAQLGALGSLVNIIVIPTGTDALSVDYQVADFTIDADGYLYFTIYNHTAGQEEQVGQFLVSVDRVTWA